MTKVSIVTDSTADLPLAVTEKLGIHVVPLKVHFGEEEYLDWVELDSESFYTKLHSSDIMPRTSQPSPADFEAVYNKIGKDNPIISLHLSAKLSGTCQSAQIAKSTLDTLDIEVIDTKLASMALGIVVIEAARAANEGKGKEEILDQINKNIQVTKIFFGVDTLEYLQKNGRIGKASALLGGMLNVKPLLMLKDGVILPKEKVRGRGKLMDRLVDIISEDLGSDVKGKVVIMHGNVLNDALKLKEKIDQKYNFSEVIITSLGAVIGTHTGPGVLGIAVLPE